MKSDEELAADVTDRIRRIRYGVAAADALTFHVQESARLESEISDDVLAAIGEAVAGNAGG